MKHLIGRASIILILFMFGFLIPISFGADSESQPPLTPSLSPEGRGEGKGEGASSLSSEGQSGEVPAAPQEEQAVEERWGIKILLVRTTAEGFFLDFRYRVIDPEKSMMLLDRKVKPYLIIEKTGEKVPVLRTKLGPMRQTAVKPTADRNYAILFGNPGKSVKKGDKVTVVIGDFRAEKLAVQ